MNAETTTKLVRIANHYGLMPQMNQCIEECSELIKECSKSIRHGVPTEGIAEEIADVYVMINQIAYLTKTPKSLLEEIIEEKLDRQLARIEESKKKC